MKAKENRRGLRRERGESGIENGLEDRISAVARQIGTRKKAAQAAGVSTDSLQRYLRGERIPPLDVAAALAKAAGCSLDWLASGRPEPHFVTAAPAADTSCHAPMPPTRPGTEADGRGSGIPLLADYDGLVSWIARQTLAPDMERHPTGARVGAEGYALRMTGRAMEPIILSGALVIVDPAKPARCDDCVVLAVEEWREVVVRRWVIDLGRVRLEPLAQGYRTVDITDLEYVYAGRVVGVETRTERRGY